MKIPAPTRYNIKIARAKHDGSFNLTGLQLARLAQAAQDHGMEVSWELDGGMVVWGVTNEEMQGVVAYLGQLGRTIEVTHVG